MKKPAGTRDKFSGHWWIKSNSKLSVEIYHSLSSWTVMGIYRENVSQIKYTKLDPKRNIVYPTFYSQVIPDFISIRALLKWIEVVESLYSYSFYEKSNYLYRFI